MTFVLLEFISNVLVQRGGSIFFHVALHDGFWKLTLTLWVYLESDRTQRSVFIQEPSYQIHFCLIAGEDETGCSKTKHCSGEKISKNGNRKVIFFFDDSPLLFAMFRCGCKSQAFGTSSIFGWNKWTLIAQVCHSVIGSENQGNIP
ncbi:hypothetical protein Ocin01_15269 [Orchesella cincta]|uniref:Uncharacterized protein n=1 Tax=Orchesella cincta TaxID=48709 RepID=A0A1D2MEV7_ORCCI|nr:hypothetical protein Ocin01_15269 [Orchesella cincta]